MNIELEQAAFGQWLEVHRAEVVGRAGCTGVCPLANWLEEMTGLRCEVYPFSWFCAGYGSSPLPQWTRLFVQMVDGAYASQAVTGEQALALLAAC